MNYLFDTNIFIASKNQLPSDVWPTFWHRVATLIKDEKIFSSIKVKEEIERGDDELTSWMRNNAVDSFYIPLDKDIIVRYQETQNWANNKNTFKPAALHNYADVAVADAYLVATAAAKKMVLVTFEKSNPLCKNRVLIPDACQAIGVKCCDLNTAFRELGITI